MTDIERILQMIDDKAEWYRERARNSGVKSTSRLNEDKAKVLERIALSVRREVGSSA